MVPAIILNESCGTSPEVSGILWEWNSLSLVNDNHTHTHTHKQKVVSKNSKLQPDKRVIAA